MYSALLCVINLASVSDFSRREYFCMVLEQKKIFFSSSLEMLIGLWQIIRFDIIVVLLLAAANFMQLTSLQAIGSLSVFQFLLSSADLGLQRMVYNLRFQS